MRDDDDVSNDEQDVLVVLKLSNRSLGTEKERLQFAALGEQLGEAIASAGVGEYDGDEVGSGDYTLFFAGADAEKLCAVLVPLLKRVPACRGARVIKQFGLAADGTPQQVSIQL